MEQLREESEGREVATLTPHHSLTLTHYHQLNRPHHSFPNSQAISTIPIDLCSTVPVASICPVSSVNGQTDYICTTAQCVPPSFHYITGNVDMEYIHVHQSVYKLGVIELL